jgi:aerobic carbon-monoxide dehydrogenase medium subunit
MYSAAFDYHRAGTVQDAQELLARHPGARLLAGGHSLIPLLKLRLAAPDAVIDIGRIPELRGVSAAGDALRIGALTTHAEIAASADVLRHARALAEAAALVGDPAVRNRGTIGGNVAHADPASDLPTVLVALAAELVALGPGGERTIPAEQFFTGMMSTALHQDEILTAVLVPRAAAGQASAYMKFAHPASRYAVVGAAASVSGERGVCTAVSVAVGGLVPFPRRARAVEQSLTGQQPSPEAIAAAAEQVSQALDDVTGDIYASAEYRRAVAPVFVTRAVTAAVARAGLS